MKKPLLMILLSVLSIGAWAKPTCSQIGSLADDNYLELDALSVFEVAGENGSRLYFYSAPSAQCRSDKFVIPKDTVLGYYLFIHENKKWLYAVYKDKNNNKTSGWLQEEKLSFLETTALDD